MEFWDRSISENEEEQREKDLREPEIFEAAMEGVGRGKGKEKKKKLTMVRSNSRFNGNLTEKGWKVSRL